MLMCQWSRPSHYMHQPRPLSPRQQKPWPTLRTDRLGPNQSPTECGPTVSLWRTTTARCDHMAPFSRAALCILDLVTEATSTIATTPTDTAKTIWSRIVYVICSWAFKIACSPNSLVVLGLCRRTCVPAAANWCAHLPANSFRKWRI